MKGFHNTMYVYTFHFNKKKSLFYRILIIFLLRLGIRASSHVEGIVRR